VNYKKSDHMPYTEMVSLKDQIARAVIAFQSDTLFENGINLFTTLGYNTGRQNPLEDSTFTGFSSMFIDETSRFN